MNIIMSQNIRQMLQASHLGFQDFSPAVASHHMAWQAWVTNVRVYNFRGSSLVEGV